MYVATILVLLLLLLYTPLYPAATFVRAPIRYGGGQLCYLVSNGVAFRVKMLLKVYADVTTGSRPQECLSCCCVHIM